MKTDKVIEVLKDLARSVMVAEPTTLSDLDELGFEIYARKIDQIYSAKPRNETPPKEGMGEEVFVECDYDDAEFIAVTYDDFAHNEDLPSDYIPLKKLTLPNLSEVQDIRNLILVNVDSADNISDEWIYLWGQVEIWYGDIQKKETGQELLKRLQSAFELKQTGN